MLTGNSFNFTAYKKHYLPKEKNEKIILYNVEGYVNTYKIWILVTSEDPTVY